MNTSPDWGETGSRWTRFGHRLFGSPTRAIAALVGVIVLVTGLSWGFRWVTADTRGAIDAREQILADGDFRIQAYQTFFDLCNDITAQEARAQIFSSSEDPLTSTNANAVLAVRAELAADYNSRAQREWTEGQFRDAELPYEIPVAWTVGEEETTCGTARD